MSTQRKQNIVQIVMVKPIYKRFPWSIPIENLGGTRYHTGQELSYPKMIGEEPLTPEEQKRYPFVIDPTAGYKVPDRQIFNVTVDELGVAEDPRALALYKLILLTGQVAKNKIDYDINPVQYIGYFYDKESEAKRSNEIDDLRYEAETLVREAGLDLRKKVALLLNYKVPDRNFFINLATVSDDILKRELVRVSRDHPELLMSCFPEINEGVESELFIVELLHYKLIIQKPDGDIYYGSKYLGKTIEEVARSLSKEDMTSAINKWGIQLQELKGSRPVTERSFMPPADKEIAVQEKPAMERLHEAQGRFKEAMFDNDLEAATGFLRGIREIYKEVVRENPGFTIPFEKYEQSLDSLRATLAANAVNEKRIQLEEMTIEQLQKKIKHHMTPYKEEDCVEFWDDKEKLIDYMLSK